MEVRGSALTSGAVWGVPYALMSPADATASIPRAPRAPLAYYPDDPDNPLLEALHQAYSALSPENLSCDGELAPSQVARRRADLNARVRRLNEALGYAPDEGEVWAWADAKRTHERAYLAR
jgi:hypothetical protein